MDNNKDNDQNNDSEEVPKATLDTASLMRLFVKPNETDRSTTTRNTDVPTLPSKWTHANNNPPPAERETKKTSASAIVNRVQAPPNTGTIDDAVARTHDLPPNYNAITDLSSTPPTGTSSLLDMFDAPTPVYRTVTAKPDMATKLPMQMPFLSPSNNAHETMALLPTNSRLVDVNFGENPTSPHTKNGKPPNGRHVQDEPPRIPAANAAAAAQKSPPSKLRECGCGLLQLNTYVGALMFVLYHCVFCLTIGSAIIRPSGTQPILGIMTKMAALGILSGAPFLVYLLPEIPAIYPTCDLFAAPFYAEAAILIDTTLAEDSSSHEEYSDSIFFGSFAVLVGIGLALTGFLQILAARVKLANLGTFLPYSVLCGFFSAVAILLWALAFSVDNGGKSWKTVFLSGDSALIQNCLVHHAPSLAMGTCMYILGPKHPLFVFALVFCTVLLFYITMWLTGTTFEEAQEAGWFWANDSLVYEENSGDGIGFWDNWTPPAPFGGIGSLLSGNVHWGAVRAGLKTIIAMATLTMLRNSIHGIALKKNVTKLTRWEPIQEGDDTHNTPSPSSPEKISPLRMPTVRMQKHRRKMSEAIDIENPHKSIRNVRAEPKLDYSKMKEIRPKVPRHTPQEIFLAYAYEVLLVAVVGGFAPVPSVSISTTMYAMGAEGIAPQYASFPLLIAFYQTNFQLVAYVPKAAFASLLVLGAVQNGVTWFYGSFYKMTDMVEWFVVPLIAVFSLIVGFLEAILLGIGISTLVFVAAFFRIGVVKFFATGLTIRSTIERNLSQANWLDKHGDLIQVLVLQTYLFFGNASSVLNYVNTMFEEPDEFEAKKLDFPLPPMPKILIIDMALITGMDTFTVDVISEIKDLCDRNSCKLFLSGTSPRLRSILALGNIKPEGGERSKRRLRFFPDLDMALGKAEDLLTSESEELNELESRSRQQLAPSDKHDGFFQALRKIDLQHGEDFACDLFELQPHTSPIELEPGEELLADNDVLERGLFFIESGTMKIERDAGATLTRGDSVTKFSRSRSFNTLNRMHARIGTVGRQTAALKNELHGMKTQNFRLARIGPGWVCGAIEAGSGLRNPGVHKAVSYCRLHHLPFSKIEKLEEENPVLILKLHKMLSLLMARRQEITIEQLATLHSIMSPPAHSKPLISRRAKVL